MHKKLIAVALLIVLPAWFIASHLMAFVFSDAIMLFESFTPPQGRPYLYSVFFIPAWAAWFHWKGVLWIASAITCLTCAALTVAGFRKRQLAVCSLALLLVYVGNTAANVWFWLSVF